MAVVWAAAAGAAGVWKKRVMENCGKRLLPLRQSVALAPALSPLALLSVLAVSRSEADRLTRCTPSTRRRLEMTLATLSWLVVHPTISIAGAAIAPRRGSLTPPSRTFLISAVEPI